MMEHNCYNCANLDKEKKSAGKLMGNLYYCKKNKVFVNAATNGCEKWSKSSRKGYEDDEIYKDSKDYYNNNTPIGVLAFVLIVLVILGLILGVFK